MTPPSYGLEDNSYASQHKNFLEVQRLLSEADTPTENRYAYIWLYSWWRHPIKRIKQRRWLKELSKEQSK